MAAEFCQKCKQSHPGRDCDYDEKGECAETVDIYNADTDSGIRPAATRTPAPKKSPS